MQTNKLMLLALVLALVPNVARADITSFTGTLSSSTDVVEETLTLTSPAAVTLQTWGFGGGVNAAGHTISPGGTDPFLGIFSGTGMSAAILTDGLGNPFGTSLDLSNYGNPDFLGCPPAGAPVIGGSSQCGDITMMFSTLAAGTYTVLLSDGQYIPQAAFDNGTLGEGFIDFTGGAFCNVFINGVGCPDPLGGAYAFDVVTRPLVAATPEPAWAGTSLGAALLGLAIIANSFRVRSIK
jgi:hypothetical protein